MDGEMDVWDYYYKQNDPTLSVKVTDKPLTAFNIQGDGATSDPTAGRLVTVGAADGSATLMELCEGLSVMQPNEKQTINQMFEREARREKNLEARQKELRNEAKRAAARAAQDDDGKRDSISNGAVMEAEKEFLAATKQGAGFEDISPLEMPLKGE